MRHPDEDERLRALLGEQSAAAAPVSEESNPLEREPDADPDDAAPTPPAAAPPQQLASQSYAPEFDGLGAMPYEPPARRVDLEAPPMKEAPGLPQTIVGGVLDVLINKGRGLPGIVAGLGSDDTPYDNWKRKKEWSESVNGGGRGYASPQSLWLRQQALQQRRVQFDALLKARDADRKLRERGFEQGDQRIKIAEGGQKLKETAQDRDLNPDNPQLAAMKTYAYSLGAPAGSLDGMDAKAVREVKALLEKDMETRSGSPLAQQDTSHAADKAGAVSAATLPDRLAVADHMAQNRTTGGLTPEQRDATIAEWERLHPGMYVDSPELFARNRLNAGRGEVKARGDEQQSARLMAAVQGMQEIIRERHNTPITDLQKHYELRRKYNIASSKATGALSELSHNNTESGRTLDAGKIPSYENPDADNMLHDAADVYSDAAGAIMGTYGVKMGQRSRASQQPALTAHAPTGDLGVTTDAPPRVDRVVKPHAAKPKRKFANEDDDLGVTYE